MKFLKNVFVLVKLLRKLRLLVFEMVIFVNLLLFIKFDIVGSFKLDVEFFIYYEVEV